MQSEKYLEDFKIRFIYHSNNLSNSSLSAFETLSLITLGYIDKEKKEVKEIYKVLNLSKAVDYVLYERQILTVGYIKKLHTAVMRNLDIDNGKFRTTAIIENAVVSNKAPANSLDKIVENYVEQINQNLTKGVDDIFIFTAKIHILFDRISPFGTANRVIGRLIINKVLLENGQTPVVIEGDNNKEKYEQILKEENIDALALYIFNASKKERGKIIAFIKREQREKGKSLQLLESSPETMKTYFTETIKTFELHPEFMEKSHTLEFASGGEIFIEQKEKTDDEKIIESIKGIKQSKKMQTNQNTRIFRIIIVVILLVIVALILFAVFALF